MNTDEEVNHSNTNVSESAILAEQVLHSYSAINTANIATFINSPILIFILWSVVEHDILLIWLTLIVLVTLSRGIAAYQYKMAKPRPEKVHLWMRRYLIDVFLTALIWGASAIWLFPTDELPHQVFLAFVVGGMAAGAVTALSYIKLAIYSFLGLSLIPLLIMFFYTGTELGNAMGFMITLYLVMLVFAANRNHAIIKQNICMKIKSIEHEHILQSKAEQLQTVISSAPLVLWSSDKNGTFTFSEGYALEAMGLKPGQVVGQSVFDLYTDFPKIVDSIKLALLGETVILETKVGGRYYDSHYIPHYNEQNEIIGCIGVAIDITERKQLELTLEKYGEELEDLVEQRTAELHQSQKMEALGKLTGGIAHEYNNMLAVTIGFAALLEKALVEQPKLAKYARDIHRAGERGAKLTSKLLTFSRQNKPEAKSLNLNTFLQQQHHMLEKTLTVRINLVFNLQENLWRVWLDKGDIEDSIINMSINAMHAIEGNGQLTIQTHNQNINQIDAQSLGILAGDYVLLSLTDTGCGIDKKTEEKIFDPFFTTKGLEGTGLGLSMVYGFVKNSGGAIKVYSKRGEGTQFTLYFPRYHGVSRTHLSEKENHSEDDFIGNKTILVVDDEPVLLDLTNEILSSHGFKVFCAESAKDALNILQHESFDILISDIIMPDMDGYQLAAIVKEKYPEIKIQLASGFTDECNMSIDDEYLQKNLLHKPFSTQDLLKRVRALCDED